MDDFATAAEAPKHIAVRAEEIWRERKAKGYSTRAKQLAELLVAEGYRRVDPSVARAWIAGWIEDGGETGGVDDESPEGMMANLTEIVANARAAVTQSDLQAIHRGLLSLINVSEAISKRIVEVMPTLKVESADELGKLVDIMGRAAESAERMSRASDFIRTRHLEVAAAGARSVNAEILPPSSPGSPPPHVMNGLKAWQSAMADTAAVAAE